MRMLHLESLKLTLGSLRPGGATHFFMSGTPVSTLQYMGRWSNEKSLRCYIQEAVAAFVLAKADKKVLLRLQRFVRQGAFLRLPPSVGYFAFISRACRRSPRPMKS